MFDVDIQAHDPVELCRRFRALSVAPILVFLPGHHETQVLDCYGAGADEVIVKPISPAIFQAKVTAWMRRSWSLPVSGLGLVKAAMGMGLPGKQAGMSGELAPKYWQQGRQAEVLAYVAQDVRTTLDLASIGAALGLSVGDPPSVDMTVGLHLDVTSTDRQGCQQ